MNDIVSNPFGGSAPAAAESASAIALVQREVAELQTAMLVAKERPRDPREAMDKIINACTRPSLAAVAQYQFAKGGTDITGPSIRLAEELARGWGNILAGTAELSRVGGVSEMLAYAWDLESGYRDERRFQVKHWRDTRSGGYALKDEREIYELTANQGSRRKRACILAVIPGDVVEAALEQCEVTLRTEVEVTPETIASLLGMFGKFGVTKEHIEKRIQRRIDAMTPGQMRNLGKVYNSLKDGMSSPADWFEDIEKPNNGNGSSRSLADITGNQTDAAPEKPAADAKPKAPAEPEGDAPVTHDEVKAMLDNAKSRDQLDEAADLVNALPKGPARNELKKRVLEKYKEFDE